MKPVVLIHNSNVCDRRSCLGFWPRARQRRSIFFQRRRRLFLHRYRRFRRHHHYRLAILLLIYYLPAMFWLRRKTSRPLSFAVAGGLILNLPTFILFYLLIGRKMVASEAILFMLTFLIMGAIFGLGFLWTGSAPSIAVNR